MQLYELVTQLVPRSSVVPQLAPVPVSCRNKLTATSSHSSIGRYLDLVDNALCFRHAERSTAAGARVFNALPGGDPSRLRQLLKHAQHHVQRRRRLRVPPPGLALL